MDLKLKDNSKLRFALFTQLEYIESTGTQYIDTGFKPNQDTRVVLEFNDLNHSPVFIFGARNSQSNGQFGYINGITKNQGVRYNYQQDLLEITNNVKLILDANKNIWALSNGNRIALVYQTFQLAYNCFLFGINDIGNPILTELRLYSCKIYDNDTLIRDFIPAKDYNNVVCLYDTISRTFFYNQGTGDFVAGPVVKSIIPYNILLKTTTLYHKNTPNVNGLQLLDSILNAQEIEENVVLNRIRVDIGNVSRGLSELMRYSGMAGFNDNYEPQNKPRLIGTWTINDWYLPEQILEAQSYFDGLTIQGDGDHLIDLNNNIVLQTLDPNAPQYNPALSIVFQRQGWGVVLDYRPYNQGNYFLTTEQARIIDIPNNFMLQSYGNFPNPIEDTNCIVSSSVSYYPQPNTFYIWKYFPLETTLNGSICHNNSIDTFDVPEFVNNYGSGTYGSFNNMFVNSYVHLNNTTPLSVSRGAGGNPYKILLGSGDKYIDKVVLESYYYSEYSEWYYYSYLFDTWYNYCAPQISYDGTDITMVVSRPSEIYYTLDGTIPTSESAHYTGPFAWDGNGVIKAVGIETVDNVQYPIYADNFYSQTTENPVITISSSTVSITSESGATIYYTTDGTPPTLESQVYSEPIQMTGDKFKIRCFSRKSDKNDSSEVSKFIILNDLLWNTFALQCIDPTKPNYNPAACIILNNNRVVKFTDMVMGGGGYITKTDAATFNIGGSTTGWYSPFDGVVNATSTIAVKLLYGTYSFDSFDELKYFTATTTLGNGSFRGCTNLRNVALDNITVYGSGCFDHSGIPGTIEINADNPGTGTFVSCTNLVKAVINVNAGYAAALNGYAGNNGYFSNSTNLEEVEVNENVTGFGSRCFASCNKLEVVHLIGDTVKTIDTSSSLPSLIKFYVGDGSSASHDDAILQSYLADSNWANYSSQLDTWYNYLHPTV